MQVLLATDLPARVAAEVLRQLQAVESAAPVRVPAGFVRIAPGAFVMGSPATEPGRSDDETQHRVTLTRPLLLQATPITEGQWRAVMGEVLPRQEPLRGDDHPLTEVSWLDAVRYCRRLSAREGLADAYDDLPDGGFRLRGLDAPGYRLPTEAEWEYACRAGTVTATYAGDVPEEGDDAAGQERLDPIAWLAFNSRNGTHPVGAKQPNAWGLHDLLGQVGEWCDDRYEAYGEDVVDPRRSEPGPLRVVRGGTYASPVRWARAAFREHLETTARHQLIGFRPARTLTR
jgi:formylglycine-generating enzyme required for sulfatase activity